MVFLVLSHQATLQYLFHWQVIILFDCINPVQEAGKKKDNLLDKKIESTDSKKR